jgi:2-polyprenyl-3-methyl-5-hydroxy-6-metoxy-1,4-benzoquinol methylase
MKTKKNDWGEVWSNLNYDPDLLVKKSLESSSFSLMSTILQKKFGSFKNLTTIELGSGMGTTSLLLALQGAKPTLVDNNEIALQRAKEIFNYYNIKPKLINEDIFEFNKNNDHKYDIALSVGLIEHFRNSKREEVINTHLNLLKNDGTILIAVPNKYCFNYRIWMYIVKLIGKWNYGYEKPFSRSELLNIAEKIGLKQYQIYGAGFVNSIDNHLFVFFKIRLQKALGMKTFPLIQLLPDVRIPLIDNHLGKTLILVGGV